MAAHSNWRTYVLVLILAVALTVLYAERRGLNARRLQLRQSMEHVRKGHEACEVLDREIARKRELVEDLKNNPEEIEDAIRATQDLVREGEKIYRFKRLPDGALDGYEEGSQKPEAGSQK